MSANLRSRVFPKAQTVLDALLGTLDQTAPGLIRDLYITGSIALGDERPGQSDLDLVLVRDDQADNAATMAVLEPVLASLRKTHPGPMVDGLVLSRSDLAVGPNAIVGPRPIIFEGTVQLGEDGSGRNPVTWHTLSQCGIAWCGTPIDELSLWQDENMIRAWVRGNLESYWRPWLARTDQVLSRGGMLSLHPWFTEWGVLGVTRLHCTLATGRIVSKYGAGAYALKRFPARWHRIVREAMRIRERRPDDAQYRWNALARRRDIRDYVDMVIEDALG